MTATYRRIYDLLSPPELAELLGQDPRFTLPPGSRDAAQRMRLAMAILRDERYADASTERPEERP